MSEALTSGAFTRTEPELALIRERAHIDALLDGTPTRAGRASDDVAALRRCAAACDTENDLCALRVLAQHAALNNGRIVSPHLRPVLERLQGQGDDP